MAIATTTSIGRDVIEALIKKLGPELTENEHTQLSAFSLCESNYTQFESDGSPLVNRSQDCGAFQINKVHWNGETATSSSVCVSLEENAREAIVLYKTFGADPWNASKSCWDKPVPGW
jgi:hypothetical protein